MSISIKDIRRSRLKEAVSKHASIASFARENGLDATYVSQMLNGHRAIGEKSARNMEEKAGLPTGWFDHPQAGDGAPPLGGYSSQKLPFDDGYEPTGKLTAAPPAPAQGNPESTGMQLAARYASLPSDIKALIDIALSTPDKPIPHGLSPSIVIMVNMVREAIKREQQDASTGHSSSS